MGEYYTVHHGNTPWNFRIGTITSYHWDAAEGKQVSMAVVVCLFQAHI